MHNHHLHTTQINDSKALEIILEALAQLRLDWIENIFLHHSHVFEQNKMFLAQCIIEMNDFEVFIDVMPRLKLNSIEAHYIMENTKSTDVTDDIWQALIQLHQFLMSHEEKKKIEVSLALEQESSKVQKI